MSWEKAEQASAGKFLKWSDGPFQVQFTSPPEIETTHWDEELKKYVQCAGEDCPHCAAGDRPSVKFVFTVTMHPGGDERILTMGKVAFRELARVRRKQGDRFSTAIIEASSKGSGVSIQYSFDVIGFA